MEDIAKRLNGYYYRLEDGNNDKSICQYMRLDYLIQFLETGNYFVKRRKNFQDANEAYENKKLAFGYSAVGEQNSLLSPVQERLIPYMNIVNCPTSCWSMNSYESFLMWKSYSTEMGACIKTTIHNFISSIKIDLSINNRDNKVLCGSMSYLNKIMPSTIEEDQLFNKDIVYAEEKEFRFYFILKSDKDKDTNGIHIPVDANVMIDEVLLSPFICKDAADKLARMLKCAYNIEVKQSNIKIKL